MKKLLENKFVKAIGSFLLELLVCFIIVQLFVYFIARPIKVIGTSMYPTYYDKSIGIMYRFNLDAEDFERFDVMIIDCKQEDELIIKRLIGFPGETVTMSNDVLTIDGVVYEQDFLDEDYVNEYKEFHHTSFTTDFSITLGEDEYFVLGDNRPYSADSRHFGAFHYSDIKGRNGVILYPFSKFGAFE